MPLSSIVRFRHPGWVPAIPFLFSLALSAGTVGSSVHWQDSGYYLTAVHELSVLYPHGFVLYQYLCKGWTLLLAPVAGFTLSVHLFSALCAAGGAAFLASGSREVLVRAGAPRPGLSAVLGACVVAAGYGYWHAAILAKTYALFYLVVAALLWVLARAERRSEFTAASVLLGLAWLAHPLGVLFVPILAGYAWSRRARWRPWGVPWLLLQLLLCAAVATLPLLLLPGLGAKEQLVDMGDPRGLRELWFFVRGGRFVDTPDAFGLDASRLIQAGRVLAEEFLGAWVLAGVGGWTLYRRARGALTLILAFTGGVAAMSLLFRLEGQIDQWLVAAGIPLAYPLAAGFSRLAAWRPPAAVAAGLAGLAWSVAANAPDLRQRGHDAPELWGRAVMRSADPGSLVILGSDDSSAIVGYLQRVRGERPDLRVVSMFPAGLPWYDFRMERHAGVRRPSWEQAYRSMPGIPMDRFEVTALANANAAPGHPVFCEVEPDRRHLRPDLDCLPSGVLWRVAPQGSPDPPPDRWPPASDLDRIASRIRRSRGTDLRRRDGVLVMTWEPYETRALRRMAEGRVWLAALLVEGDPAGAASILRHASERHPPLRTRAAYLEVLGSALSPGGRLDEGRADFEHGRAASPEPQARIVSCFYLAELARAKGDGGRARELYAEALREPGLGPVWRARIAERLGSR